MPSPTGWPSPGWLRMPSSPPRTSRRPWSARPGRSPAGPRPARRPPQVPAIVADLSARADEPVVLAAGGVVWRRGEGDQLEVVLVHRPRYGDWSLPKGKLDPGEDHRAAALREVEEETGLRCGL